MKTILFIFFLGFFVLILQSCTHTCVCEDKTGKIKELEIELSESCSDRSNDDMECS